MIVVQDFLEKPNSIFQGIEIIIDDSKNLISINIKVMMGYNVSHAFHLFPFNGRIQRQEFVVSQLIKILETFSNSFYHHTRGIQFLFAFRSQQKVISTTDNFVAYLYRIDCFFYSAKNMECRLPVN